MNPLSKKIKLSDRSERSQDRKDLAALSAQRNLAKDFEDQLTVGMKLNRAQLTLMATCDMGMKFRYGATSTDTPHISSMNEDQSKVTRKTYIENITSVRGFLNNISEATHNEGKCCTPKLLHILGPPGTGKTFAVRMCYQEVCKNTKLKKINLSIINATSVTLSNNVFSRIMCQMGLNPNVGESVLERRLKKKKSLFIAVIDEIDILLNRNTHGVKELFRWACSPEFNFALIMMSNAHENQKIASLLPNGFDTKSKQTLVFRAYDKTDLIEILKLRIGGLVFQDKAINYIAKKAASEGGDCRVALSIASLAIKICKKTLSDSIKSQLFSSLMANGPPVSFKHVRMAITELDRGSPLDHIESLPAAAKIALAVATALSCDPKAAKRPITRGLIICNCSLVARHNILDILADIGNQWVSVVLDQLCDAGLIEFGGGEFDCYCMHDEKIRLRVNPVDVECSLEEAWPQEGFYRRIADIIKK